MSEYSAREMLAVLRLEQEQIANSVIAMEYVLLAALRHSTVTEDEVMALLMPLKAEANPGQAEKVAECVAAFFSKRALFARQ